MDYSELIDNKDFVFHSERKFYIYSYKWSGFFKVSKLWKPEASKIEFRFYCLFCMICIGKVVY